MMTRLSLLDLATKTAEAVGIDQMVQRQIFNLAIERMATEFRWEHLKAVYPNALNGESFVFGGTNIIYDLPTNYQQIISLKILNGNEFRPLTQMAQEEWDRLRAIGPNKVNSIPRYYMVEKNKQPSIPDATVLVQKLYIDSVPDKSYPAILRYYSMPAMYDVTNDAYNNLSSPFPDYIMLEALVYGFLNYMKEQEEANNQWKKVDYLVKTHQISQRDLSGGLDKLTLDPELYGEVTRTIF